MDNDDDDVSMKIVTSIVLFCAMLAACSDVDVLFPFQDVVASTLAALQTASTVWHDQCAAMTVAMLWTASAVLMHGFPLAPAVCILHITAVNALRTRV